MRFCVASGCPNNKLPPEKWPPGISFFSFPKDPKLLAVWLCAVKKKNWKPTKSSHLCSSHFPDHMLTKTKSGVKLKPNAIPKVTLPSFMKKALLEKERIDRTYKEECKDVSDIDCSIDSNTLQTETLTHKRDIEEEEPEINVTQMRFLKDPAEAELDENATSIAVDGNSSLAEPDWNAISPELLGTVSLTELYGKYFSAPEFKGEFIGIGLDKDGNRVEVRKFKDHKQKEINDSEGNGVDGTESEEETDSDSDSICDDLYCFESDDEEEDMDHGDYCDPAIEDSGDPELSDDSNIDLINFTVKPQAPLTSGPYQADTETVEQTDIDAIKSFVNPDLSRTLNRISGTNKKRSAKLVYKAVASTSVNEANTVIGLKNEVDRCRNMLDSYRKKVKILGQSNRRYDVRLTNLKHSIFSELLKRQYLSNEDDFKMDDAEGCVLDRHSIRRCDSPNHDKNEECL